VVDIVTGLHAALGIMMALAERERSGRGQFVEAALFDAAITLLHPHLANYLCSGVLPQRSGNAHPNITPYDSFDTATVQIFLAVGNNQQFARLCATLGRADLAADPRFASNALRNANRAALRAQLEADFMAHDGATLADRLMLAGVPCAPVLDLGAITEHPHTEARAMLIDSGEGRAAASAIRLSRTPATYRRPPPEFDAEGPAIRAALAGAQRVGVGTSPE
jgi:formyl-CoA transferase